MLELQGKTAFVTGGASGIGLAMDRAFGDAGMRVMLADIDGDGAAAATTELAKRGITGAGCHLRRQ